jgi:hypothetical protein
MLCRRHRRAINAHLGGEGTRFDLAKWRTRDMLGVGMPSANDSSVWLKARVPMFQASQATK